MQLSQLGHQLFQPFLPHPVWLWEGQLKGEHFVAVSDAARSTRAPRLSHEPQTPQPPLASAESPFSQRGRPAESGSGRAAAIAE